LVATCRPGKFSDEERARLLLKAIQHGAQYVDIEFESEVKYRHMLVEHARAKGVKVIISYHDFDKTPSLKDLEAIVEKAQLMEADIVKIATLAKTPVDCATIMSLYRKEKDLIAFCMGQLGIITRIAAPLLGAEFTFAALDDSFKTAPGQLTIEEMEKIYKIIRPDEEY
jgi:3-dehydroquinate dehydratase-1